MAANAPPTEIHSRQDAFSLKATAERIAERTITPPETKGNCTEAGTVLAAGFISLMPDKTEYENTHGAGSFENYVKQELLAEVAAEHLTDADIDAVLDHYGFTDFSVL